jgi:hypothetical protein
MTAKEMANRLFTRNHNLIQDIGGELGQEILVSILAKKLALITVDEIMNNNNKIPGNVDGLHTIENSNYWKQVKEEI